MTNKDQVPGGVIMPGISVPVGAIMPGQNLTQGALKAEASLDIKSETKTSVAAPGEASQSVAEPSTIQRRWINGQWV